MRRKEEIKKEFSDNIKCMNELRLERKMKNDFEIYETLEALRSRDTSE